MTRRRLLQRALLILGIAPAWGGGCAAPRVTSEPAWTGRLSTDEIEDLVAFGEALVEGRALAPAERRHLVDHIEDRTAQNLEFLSLYREAGRILERLAGRRFATLEIRERIELIADHQLAVGPGRGEPLTDAMRAFRMRVVPDLVRGYYSSPAGWAAVGYDSFPGRCGDLMRYTRPEA